MIGSKWKPAILWELHQRKLRWFAGLKRVIPEITQKMLTQQLRGLEADGIVHRQIYAEVPLRVKYSITKYGQTLIPILHEMV
ncbi:winged helix-turn-helix transcriptional regulator [Tunicatimonas pelagia]|uniref:winged helix-turn-helix transcriptional regulator n=1 Tax=Tunicatimonas pelagia TaxID=931531 RepID=UPI0026652916|nr:helix-turn-helix domain-containing protein [Tunicatimonas pelagia]WKN42035.1 helix-turn-helix domain-containing protein [Tunicatimonas pelagia]